MQWQWQCSKGGYATRTDNKTKTCIYMHKVVMQTPDGMECDHKHGNGLDNRKSQLRNCTHAQNSKNRKLNSDNTTGYKGVYWKKDRNRWIARIMVDGKDICLGYFKDIQEAVEARKIAESKYHGEFSRG